MSLSEYVDEMKSEQMRFLKRLQDERDRVWTDNVKAIRHELVELEHAYHWKWWTNESDFERDDAFDHDDREAYIREELIDILHFILQEVIENDTAQIQSGRIESMLTTGAPEDETIIRRKREREAEMLGSIQGLCIRELRNKLSGYDASSGDRSIWKQFVDEFGRFTAFYFDGIEDIYDAYMDKNDENHARQDGESRDGYEAGKTCDRCGDALTSELVLHKDDETYCLSCSMVVMDDVDDNLNKDF